MSKHRKIGICTASALVVIGVVVPPVGIALLVLVFSGAIVYTIYALSGALDNL